MNTYLTAHSLSTIHIFIYIQCNNDKKERKKERKFITYTTKMAMRLIPSTQFQ